MAASSSSLFMKREERLTKPELFTLVYNEGKTQTDRFLVMRTRPNQLNYSRYGISVSKHVGKAVVRNRIKRILREILRLTPLCPGWDVVLIARGPSAGSDYGRLNKSVVNLLSRAGLKAK
jgi:ribonuclease P protein component